MTISAKIIADSTDLKGVRIITFELEYPRFIHAELLVHRAFSRNSASSRAIPIATMLNTIQTDPAMPVHWGKNQPGMQAAQELGDVEKTLAMEVWNSAMLSAVEHSKKLSEIGAHKQIANRITEAFQHMKVVVTSTEWGNWYWLRDHKDAQPEIWELAKKMKDAQENSISESLYHGEMHVPYVRTYRGSDGIRLYLDSNGNVISGNDALMISASCCAQTSYRKSDDSLEKAIDIYKKLIESEPCHASPVEHQAFCWGVQSGGVWPDGYTHRDVKGQLWSGNFRSWIQHRQLIPNNAKS